MKRIIADSSILAALFNSKDFEHERAKKFLSKFKGVLVTTLPVITEVCYLLDFDVRAQADFLEWCARGGVQLENFSTHELETIASSMKKYSNLPCDFADASLLAIANREALTEIATLDSDFDVYRLANGKSLRRLPAN